MNPNRRLLLRTAAALLGAPAVLYAQAAYPNKACGPNKSNASRSRCIR